MNKNKRNFFHFRYVYSLSVQMYNLFFLDFECKN